MLKAAGPCPGPAVPLLDSHYRAVRQLLLPEIFWACSLWAEAPSYPPDRHRIDQRISIHRANANCAATTATDGTVAHTHICACTWTHTYVKVGHSPSLCLFALITVIASWKVVYWSLKSLKSDHSQRKPNQLCMYYHCVSLAVIIHLPCCLYILIKK